MKRNMLFVAILTALFMLGSLSTSYAKSGEMEVDVSGVYGSEPVSGFGFGGTYGLNIGGGYEVVDNFQARVDMAFLSWSATYDYGWGIKLDLAYKRTPITFSGRYYYPVQNNLLLYGQAGLEISLDTAEAAVAGIKVSESATNLGITPGAGIIYKVTPQVGIFGDVKWHIITDSYFTLQAGLSYSF